MPLRQGAEISLLNGRDDRLDGRIIGGGAKTRTGQLNQHQADVATTALSEHRRAVHKVSNGVRKMLWFVVNHVKEQLPNYSAVLHIAIAQGPDLRKVLQQ